MKITNPVNLIIINKDNQILLAKRAKCNMGYNGHWSIPGGGTEYGESFEETIHREIREELNCNIIDLKFFKSYFFEVQKDRPARVVYFYGQIDSEPELNDELSEYAWFDSTNDILNLRLAFNQKKVLKDFLKFLDHKAE